LDWHQFALGNSECCSIQATSEQTVAAINKAAYFQFFHALAIILVGILGVLRPSRMLWVNGFFFLMGIVLFSGSTYLSVFVNYPWLEYVKLTGVLTLVGSWILLVEAGCPGWNKKQCSVSPQAEPSST